MKSLKTITIIVLVFFTSHLSFAQKSKPVPDLAHVKYGEHERNVLDIWFADKNKITPLVIYIHGGGFDYGNKEKINAETIRTVSGKVSRYAIDKKISSVAIECFCEGEGFCQAMGEGLVLGSYQFLNYKTDKENVFEFFSLNNVFQGGNRNTETGPSNAIRLSLDYQYPVNKDLKLQFGARGDFGFSGDDQDAFEYRFDVEEQAEALIEDEEFNASGEIIIN